MTINMWGNFVWWPDLCEKPVFETVNLYGNLSQDEMERKVFTTYMEWVKAEDKGFIQWISKPVCIKVQIPSAIVNDMPVRLSTEIATGEVEVSD